MGSPRRCLDLCTAQFLLTIYCAVHILPLRGGQPRKTQSEGGAAAPEEGSNDPDRHHPEVQQGQCRRRSEELRRRLQGRPGDCGRDRRLRQEVLRAVDCHAREARRRQDARQGHRDPDRLRQVGLRGLRRAVDQARRALCEPREGGLQAVRGSRRRRQWQGREVSRKKPSTEAKRPAPRPGVLHFEIRSPYARSLRDAALQVVGTRGANDLAKRRRRFYITTQAVGRRVRRAATRLQRETNDTAWCARSCTRDYRRRRASPARRRARPGVTTTAPAPRLSQRRKPGPSVRTFTACSCSTTTTRRWNSSCTCSSASSTGRARTRRASCCTSTRTASASAASTPMRWRKPK